jgi:hypothetical protein
MVHATASVVVKWNTQAAAPTQVAVQSGTLLSLNGTHATVRMRDGTLRTFTASQGDVATLRTLIGKSIAFRVR